MVHYCFTPKSLQQYQGRIAALEEELAGLRGKVSEVTTNGGGWHDNASLDSLEQLIRFSEARLREERTPLANIRLVEYPTTVDSVCLGSRASFTRDGFEDKLDIVAYGDEDFESNRVLYVAPIALVLIGRKKGDSFSATVAGRNSRFNILDVLPL